MAITLKYMKHHGFMNVSKLILATAGKFPGDYFDERCIDVPKVGLEENLGRLPIATKGDFTIGTSAAINFYLASEFDLMGKDTREAAKILSISEHLRELTAAYKNLIPSEKHLSKDLLDRWFECGAMDISGSAIEEDKEKRYLTWWMGRIEKIIGGNGISVGSKLSLADLMIFNTFQDQETYREECDSSIAGSEPDGLWRRGPMGDQARLDSMLRRHPKIKACCLTVDNMPNIQKLLTSAVREVLCSSNIKPHSHQGILQPYDGKPLPVHLTDEQKIKLDHGDPVVYNERDGKSGYGVVIQDVSASNDICMGKICDLTNYPNMVPHVKKVSIYEEEAMKDNITNIGAKFEVGLMGLGFGYFIKLKKDLKQKTLTWTLDYRYTSDFDDNVGHWQVMPHPSKSDSTRLLYSCKVKLLPWIPEFVVNFLTTRALTEATTWVKAESENEARKRALLQPSSTCEGEGKKMEKEEEVAGHKGRGWLPSWLSKLKGGSTASSIHPSSISSSSCSSKRTSTEHKQQTRRQQGESTAKPTHRHVKFPTQILGNNIKKKWN